MNQFLTRFLSLHPKKDLNQQETKSKGLTNYSELRLNNKENLSYYLISSVFLFFIGLLFYRNIILSILFSLLSIPLKKIYLAYKINKRKEELLEGFRDTLYSISGGISAGRQMPQAISDAAVQLERSYGAKSDICIEIRHIDAVYQETHADIGSELLNFAKRSTLEEIKQFADSYLVCKKTGADLEGVCFKSCSLLLDKIEYKNEVKSIISQKKLDILLLTAMPIAVLLLLNLLSYSYIAVLYESMLGRIVMTMCLVLIMTALYLGLKIVNLKL